MLALLVLPLVVLGPVRGAGAAPCDTSPVPAVPVQGADTPDKSGATVREADTYARWNWVSGDGDIHATGVGVCDGVDPALLEGAPTWPGWDIARGLALYADAASAVHGWVLDGWGGLHALNGAPRATVAYWPGWDIARDIAVTGDGRAGVTLDGYGGLHPFGGDDPPVPLDGAAYWRGWDIARAVVLEPDGGGGWVFDAWGGVHEFGEPRTLVTSNHAVGVPGHYLPGVDWVRSASIQHDVQGEFVVVVGWYDGAYAQANWIFPAER